MCCDTFFQLQKWKFPTIPSPHSTIASPAPGTRLNYTYSEGSSILGRQTLHAGRIRRQQGGCAVVGAQKIAENPPMEEAVGSSKEMPIQLL